MKTKETISGPMFYCPTVYSAMRFSVAVYDKMMRDNFISYRKFMEYATFFFKWDPSLRNLSNYSSEFGWSKFTFENMTALDWVDSIINLINGEALISMPCATKFADDFLEWMCKKGHSVRVTKKEVDESGVRAECKIECAHSRTYPKIVDKNDIPSKRFKDLSRGETFMRVSDLMMKISDETAVDLHAAYTMHIAPDELVKPVVTTITVGK